MWRPFSEEEICTLPKEKRYGAGAVQYPGTCTSSPVEIRRVRLATGVSSRLPDPAVGRLKELSHGLGAELMACIVGVGKR